MLRIRLTRRGAKKEPHYRVVVADKKKPRDGRFVEIVGFYNPAWKPVRLHLELDRVDYWLDKGARPSETVKHLIKKFREHGSSGIPEVTGPEEETPGAKEASSKEESSKKEEKETVEQKEEASKAEEETSKEAKDASKSKETVSESEEETSEAKKQTAKAGEEKPKKESEEVEQEA